MNNYYLICFLLTQILTGVYLFVWRKNYDSHITLVFVLIPLITFSHLQLAQATTLESALNAYKYTVIGGCFLQMIFMFTTFSLCRIHLNRWLKLFFMLISTLVFLSALTIGEKDWYYKNAYLEQDGSSYVLVKEYGVMHSAFYILVCVYFIMSLGSIIYAFLRKNQISRKILMLLFLPELVCMLSFFGGRMVFPQIELLPAAYVFVQMMYLAIVYRISLYDVIETAVETMAESGSAGFVTFDLNRCYLGSNETAKEILPELNDLTVDFSLRRNRTLWELISPWLDAFESHPEKSPENKFHYEKDDKIYSFNIEWLSGGKHKRGYQIFIEDDTTDQAYIKLLDGYNSDLKTEVEAKTANLVEMHNNLVLSMATMIESRDNSTGGHIRRTSEGVRLLINAMKSMPQPPDGYPMNEEFCRNLIKAAPMHDLGKIAVDDKILRKPGKFTDEEYAEMQKHPAEGAKILKKVLREVDDEDFVRIAVNIANFHHEHFDGTGYPDHRAGEEIPVEARIMALADVFDALVSKRCYKEAYSYDKAFAIMEQSLGTLFDPVLGRVFLDCREELAALYREMEQDTGM